MSHHVIERWAKHPEHGRCFVAQWSEPAKPAVWADLPGWVPAPLRAALAARGIERVYAHQAEALRAIGEKRHVVVATPTASGKTLVYNTAVLTACLEDAAARALYLFPTKALAHDQVVECDALARACGSEASAHCYDGDTPADARRAIRAAARIVVTNPDMLHTGILPHHDRWQALFAGLRYVVLDEVHTYRGVFGSHVANVLRRLKRVARFHGSDPVFVLCSATIANPRQHAAQLIEAPVVCVDESGAPRGPRRFFVYNPPIVDGAKGIRGSYIQAARRLARSLTREEVPTIVFANSRLSVERLTRHLQEDVAADGGDPEVVAGYRGGYLPEHRRGIEKGLRDGRIRTVVSTSALELGVDIGQLEACVLAGYPGSIASALQRAGRAGRRNDGATIVLVTRSEPSDQYIASHPEFLSARSPEHARVQPDNLLVVSDHVKCAAFELPFEVGEGFGGFAPADTDAVLGYLSERGLLHRGARRWQWTGEPYPAHQIGLRSIAEGNFTVLDMAHRHTVIGEVDYHSAASTLYPQAIYIVGGRTYQVKKLDWVGRRAEVEPVHVDYYTDSMTFDGVRILDVFEEAPLHDVAARGHGEVRVFERVVGFKKIRFATGENVGYGDVDLPDNELHTTAFWIRVGPALLDRSGLPRHQLVDALEGIGHALRYVATVHLMCDPGDLGHALVGAEGDAAAPAGSPSPAVVSEGNRGRAAAPAGSPSPAVVSEGNRGRTGAPAGSPSPAVVSEGNRGRAAADELPTLYLFERYPGGVGFHEPLYAEAETLLSRLALLLDNCRCEDGCPGCVGAPAPVAHPADRPRSRKAARAVLGALVGAPRRG